MRKIILLCLIATSFAWSQSAPAPAQTHDVPPGAPNASTQAPAEKDAAELPSSAAVITLHGYCPDKPSADPNSPDCQTVITRAEFERLVATLAPSAPGSVKQQLAGDYSRYLLLANEAKKRGLDKTDKYRDIMAFMQIRVLAQELLTNMQQQAKPTPEQVQKYYNDNQAKFEQITLSRVFVPRNHPVQAATGKDGKTQPPAPQMATDVELQAAADQARARLVAGEPFEKVQKDVYEASGYKTPPPPTTIPSWRKDAAPADQQFIFDMKKGEISKVIMEPAGAYIYRVDERKPIPLEQTRPEIESQLQNQNMQQLMSGITGKFKPEFNQSYFRPMGGEGGEGGPPMPQGTPQVMRPPQGATPAPKAGPAPKAAPASTPKK